MHQLEKSAFPEYAETQTDVSRYISLRNKIVEAYRDFPQIPLYATDCLRHVSADASTVFRVHSFLDYWGIINTESDARVRYSKAMFCLSNFDTPRGVAKRLAEQGSSKNIRNCSVTGEPLQRMHYASQKWPGVYLSPLAISTGMIPLHMAASDFRKKVLSDPLTASKPSFDDWTEEETNRLVDAIQRCGDDWDVVAQCVGGKTMQQCVLHFARLPIADRFIEDCYPLKPRNQSEDRKYFPGDWSPSWFPWLESLKRSSYLEDAYNAAINGDRAKFGFVAVTQKQQSHRGQNLRQARRSEKIRTPLNGKATIMKGKKRYAKNQVYDGPLLCHESLLLIKSSRLEVLQWPYDSTTAVPKVGSFIVLICDEARRNRGCIKKIYNLQAGIFEVELCGCAGMVTLQLLPTQYRVVSDEEVRFQYLQLDLAEACLRAASVIPMGKVGAYMMNGEHERWNTCEIVHELIQCFSLAWKAKENEKGNQMRTWRWQKLKAKMHERRLQRGNEETACEQDEFERDAVSSPRGA
eukprot:767948-Hanusia_phi.AAC.11